LPLYIAAEDGHVEVVGFLLRGSAGVKQATTESGAVSLFIELELELIQTHMAQKPLLWVEVGAHAVRNKSKCVGVGWAGASVAWRLGVCVVFGTFWAVWMAPSAFFVWCSPAGGCVPSTADF
jgi:hypothetical protein